MALDRTSGFDMLVQVSERELNSQLAAAFVGGTIFPPSMSIPISTGGVVGTADVNFTTPTIDLDRPRPQIGVTVPFNNSQIELTAPLPLVVSPLGGRITIVDAIQIVVAGAAQAAVLDFNDGAPTVTVVFDTPSQALLAPLLAAAGLNITQAQNMMAGQVLAELQAHIGRLFLTPWIPIADDASPTTIFDLDVTTVNDTTAADRDCLAFGVRMSNDTGGNIGNVTSNLIPPGSETLVMMSNFWLLSKVMRPTVAAALGRPITDFDTPLRLNTPIPAPGGTGTLTDLEARVIGNRIQIDGRATASGTGWSAVSNFTFFVSLSIDATGSIAISTSTPIVNTDFDLEWWVWLVSLGLGALFGGIIGVIVAAVVLAVTESVIEGVGNSLVSSGISGALGSFSSIPLGPIGSGLQMTALVLDDLELRGSIIRMPAVPVRSQGTSTTFALRAFDLDSGVSASVVLPESDLVWNPATGLSVHGPARLAITGASFGALGPLEIAALAPSGTSISIGLIPTFLNLGPFSFGGQLVFAMRTGDGRLAKCRAWRDLGAGLALHLDWVTYDNPIPRLDIAALWTVAERGPVDEYISADCSRCHTSEVAWCGRFEAWPRLMAFPIDYQWCLCGTILDEDDGAVDSPHGPIAYTLSGRHLHIRGELGQSIECELCVSAIDHRNAELFTCISLAQQGVETICVPCRPRPRHTLNITEPESTLAGWRPALAMKH